jgi:hypothetical protein
MNGKLTREERIAKYAAHYDATLCPENRDNKRWHIADAEASPPEFAEFEAQCQATGDYTTYPYDGSDKNPGIIR